MKILEPYIGKIRSINQEAYVIKVPSNLVKKYHLQGKLVSVVLSVGSNND